jgi:ABC-type nitrate/sulfonate/bicarbonate transport system substrate-binding protein
VKFRHVPLIAAATAVIAAGSLTACGGGAQNAAADGGAVTIRYQGSAGAVTLPEVAEHFGWLGNVKLNWVGNTISGPQDIQSVATNQTDVGGAFNGAIVKLAASSAPIESVISYYGSNEQSYLGFFVLDGSPIKSAKDLIGKKVGVNTLGAHLEAAIDTWLARGGLTPAEIKQVELDVIPPVNTDQALRAHQIDVAALSGILQQKALKSGGVHELFRDIDLFGPFNAGSYVFRKDFIQAHPQAVKDFVSGIAKAIDWERTTPKADVIKTFTDILTARKRTGEDASALPFWLSSGVVSPGGVISTADFSRWIDWLVAHGDLTKGQIDPNSLFTNAFNPDASSATATSSTSATS